MLQFALAVVFLNLFIQVLCNLCPGLDSTRNGGLWFKPSNSRCNLNHLIRCFQELGRVCLLDQPPKRCRPAQRLPQGTKPIECS